MNSTASKQVGCSVSVVWPLTILFIVLKLVGVVSWSWWIVFLPVIVSYSIGLIFLVLFALISVALVAFDPRDRWF